MQRVCDIFGSSYNTHWLAVRPSNQMDGVERADAGAHTISDPSHHHDSSSSNIDSFSSALELYVPSLEFEIEILIEWGR
jgi:hypothetical protein